MTVEVMYVSFGERLEAALASYQMLARWELEEAQRATQALRR